MNDFLRELLALPVQATDLAREVDALHFVIIGVTMGGAALVGFAAIYFVIKYRRRPNDPEAAQRLTERVHAPMSVELIWAGSLLAFFLAVWLVGFKLYIRLTVPPPDAMEVYVTGKQWMWQFAYPDGRGDISVLTVPVNRPVKLNMISRDVIHSFSVPAFRIKQDVLPGRYMTAWFTATKPGVYEILCAEFCGVGHSNMWGNVVVLSPGDYELWERGGMPLALQRARELTTAQRPVGILAGGGMLEQGVLSDESTTLAELGRIVAVKHACFACHTVDGRIHIGPTWSGLYGAERRLESGAVVHADPSYLTESMMDPRAQVVAGFAPVMPSYQGLLSGAESAALVEYIKSLRDQEATNTRIPTTAKD